MKRLAALAALLFPLAVSSSPAAEFRPLWDGRTLQGWHVIGKGRWEIVEGALRGTQQKGEAAFGHLVTDREFTNFTVRVQYKAVRGNSGLYFRIEEKGYSGVSGFQAEIDPDHDAGGLYETNGRSWVSKPKAADVQRWFKPGEWNEMTVTARGGDITVTVNGIQSAVLKNDPGRRHGRIALQVHGGQDVEVWFRNLAVSELTSE